MAWIAAKGLSLLHSISPQFFHNLFLHFFKHFELYLHPRSTAILSNRLRHSNDFSEQRQTKARDIPVFNIVVAVGLVYKILKNVPYSYCM